MNIENKNRLEIGNHDSDRLRGLDLDSKPTTFSRKVTKEEQIVAGRAVLKLTLARQELATEKALVAKQNAELEAVKAELKRANAELSMVKETAEKELVKAYGIIDVMKDKAEICNKDIVKLNRHQLELKQEGTLEIDRLNAYAMELIEHENQLNEEIDALNENIDVLENKQSNLARMAQIGTAVTGGIAAAYVAYQNPAMMLEILQGLEIGGIAIGNLAYSNIPSTLMPYAAELAAAVAGLTGYLVAGRVGPTALYALVRLVQVVDYVAKALLKAILITLPVECLKEVCELTIDIVSIPFYLLKKVIEYRGAASAVALAVVLAYYNPETAASLMQFVSQSAVSAIEYANSESGMQLIAQMTRL